MLLMMTVNLVLIYKNTSSTSEIMLSTGCENQAYALNNRIQLVKQAVQSFYEVTENFRPDVNSFRNPKVVDDFSDKVLEYAIAMANNTTGAASVYYRFNPDITSSGLSGFFYTKNSNTGSFEKCKPTNIYDYEPSDMENVGWYYVPIWAGKPVWSEPYYTSSVDTQMISYGIPVYDGTYLVGVMGMDMNFDMLKDVAEDINVYESNGAVLCNMDTREIYYNKCSLLGDTIPDDLYLILSKKSVSDGVFTYYINRKPYCAYFVTLDNNMKLLVYAKKSEVYMQTTSTLIYSMVVFALILSVTLLLSLRMSKKIITPIKRITDATMEYSKGNWETKVDCNTGDELQLLSENITNMADKTKEYIEYIQNMAKTDGLTGLRNKSDYIQYIEMMNNTHDSSERRYAVVVFDVNNLKNINDNYGHEKGDELILAASKIICRYFGNSPVFRIGGDEFVAIVDGDGYAGCSEVFAEFQKHMNLASGSDDIIDVCIASGMADSTESGTFEEIFDKADHRMYENKIKLKDGILPR